MNDIVTNTQTNPVGYIARKFAINTNIVKLVDTIVTTNNVPSLTQHQATALCTFALLRLRVAELAATDDGSGNTWDAEVTAAQTFADKVLKEAAQAFPGQMRDAADIFAKLQDWADVNNSGDIPAPGDLDADWFTSKGDQPAASAQVVTQENDVAFDIDLLDGVTNTESAVETLRVVSVDGKNWEADREIEIGGVTFTMDAEEGFNLAAPAPEENFGPVTVPVVITDDVSAPITRNLTISATTPA